MQPFSQMTAIALPLLRDNIDTDAIIPSREITAVSKQGLAPGLFAGWRYAQGDRQTLNRDFILNQAPYQDAKILLAGTNFGCGSSREQAVWALAEFGFRVILASSFNPIFSRNCVRNGVLPATLGQSSIAAIAAHVAIDPSLNRLTVDLAAQLILCRDGSEWFFGLLPESKEMLLSGLDPIDQTLALRERIDEFRDADRVKRPWVYGVERT